MDDVAAEMRRRWKFRPRAAYRHAHGWSQHEAAVRFREVACRLGAGQASLPAASVMGTRIGEYERWPHGGRRPSPYVLAVLGEVYGARSASSSMGPISRPCPPPERAVVAALVDRRAHPPEAANPRYG